MRTGTKWMSYANTVNAKGKGVVNNALTKTLVIGLGYPILGDDGIGWRVAEAVKALQPPAEVDCQALGGLSLMERLIGYERAIIIDAIQTRDGQIGQVYTLPLEALPDLSAGHTTAAHDTSLQTALELGRTMGAELPKEVVLVAVEAERVYDFSEELTPTVEKAIPAATQTVMNLLSSQQTDAGVTI